MRLTTNSAIEDAAVDWVMELERLAGRHPVDRRYDAGFPGDIWSDPLTIEVKAVGGSARGWDLPLEAAQVAAADNAPNFVLDLVDNVAQGEATLFRHRRFEGPFLKEILAKRRARIYYEVPLPVARYDSAPAHQSLASGPISVVDRRPDWAVALDASKMSFTSIVLSERTVAVATARVEFHRWSGEPLSWGESYGKTPILGLQGQRSCAEVAIVEGLRDTGWSAWWIDTFGHAPAAWASSISKPSDLPSSLKDIFSRVEATGVGKRVGGGRWDIAASKGDQALFLESKGSGDRIRPSQAIWLERALALGSPLSSFGIVNYVVRA